MALLNIVSQPGSYEKYFKFNSKSGRFYMKGDDGEVEVTPASFVADLENIKTGWLMFAAGMAPDRVWDASLTQPAPKPSEHHKRGFSVRLFSNASFGGVVELSSSSMHLCNSINDLYESFEKQKGATAGLMPVVKFTGITSMKDAKGTNYKPTFVIEKWIAAPGEFTQDATPATQAQSAPAPTPVAAPAASSVSEF